MPATPNMSRRPILVRLVMWVILVAILAAWLTAAVRNPKRAQTVFSVAFSPNGELLALGTDDGTAVLFNPVTGKRLAVLNQERFPNWTKFVLFSPDGTTLAMGGDGTDVTFWDTASWQRVQALSIQFGNSLNCATFSPDGTLLATGSEDDTIRVWTWKVSTEPREIITDHDGRINAIAWSPDGAVIATGSDDETVRLTDVVSGQETAKLFWDDQSEVNTSVRSLAFSPDGQTLLAGMDRGTVVIWDVPSGAQRVVLHLHSNAVGSVAYTQDGTRFATGCWDGTAIVCDAASNKPIHKFTADSRWVWSVAFSPDGRTLATGGDDGTAKIWDLSSGQSTRLVAEPATTHRWVLGLIVWGIVFVRLRFRTVKSDSARTESTAPVAHVPSPTPVESTGQVPTFVIYALGGFLYVVACGPAITQRGYPPIDPAWTAATFLWVFPILLAAILDPRAGVRPLKPLAVYCFITGFFDAASTVTIVPKQVNLLGSLLETIFIFGPLHLVLGLLLVMLVKGVRAGARRFLPGVTPSVVTMLRWSTFSGVLLFAVAFPFLFRQYTFFDAGNRGRAAAERDWEEGRAGWYRDVFAESGPVRHEFDPATGLKYQHARSDNEYTRAYNDRVAGLLREHAAPDWSMKRYLVPDDELVALLDSNEFEEVTTFPRELGDNIILFRRGTITRWGGTMSSSSDSLSIGTRDGGLTGTGDERAPAYVWRTEQHPGMFFIRSGTTWVGAFHESGVLLSSASRY